MPPDVEVEYYAYLEGLPVRLYTGTTKNTAETLVEQLNGSGSDAEWAAVKQLRKLESFPRLLLERFRSSSGWRTRSSCVYHAVRYARASDDAVTLGTEAMRDKAKIVRYRGCMLLAYSQRPEVLPALKQALGVANKEADREDLRAAIDAIESGNHNFFVNRDHSGKMTLTIS